MYYVNLHTYEVSSVTANTDDYTLGVTPAIKAGISDNEAITYLNLHEYEVVGVTDNTDDFTLEISPALKSGISDNDTVTYITNPNKRAVKSGISGIDYFARQGYACYSRQIYQRTVFH